MQQHTVACRDRDFTEWHGGHEHAVAWALELDLPEVRGQVAAARARLEPYLLPRYRRQPHATIAFGGLLGAGEFDQARLESDLARLREFTDGPVRVRADGWGTFPMVPYLALRCDWLEHAHSALMREAPSEHAMTFRPHVTVGHYAGTWPLTEPLALLRDLPASGEWEVTAVSLMVFETADIAGPLDVVGRLHLTDGRWSPTPAWRVPSR